MLNNKDFPKRLEKILEYYGLSASALAEEIDFNRSTISHLISGRNKPSLEFVMKLLQKFPELDMDWLVLGKGNFPSDSSTPPKKEVQKPKSPTIPAPATDLFSESENVEGPNSMKRSAVKTIERIVIFYADGTFSVYEN